MSYDRNLPLAERVLKEIKGSVTSSDDIIPRSDLPVLLPANRQSDIAKFGAERMQEFLHLVEFEEKVSSLQFKAFSYLETIGHPCPTTTIYVAGTNMGVGECGDTSNLAAILLVKYGCTSPINIIGLHGLKPNYEEFVHVVVVVGEWTFSNPPIRSFTALGDDCILIDPLIGVVGKANKWDSIMGGKEKKYLDCFNIHEIAHCGTIDPNAPKRRAEAVMVLSTARELSDQWTKRLGGKYQRQAGPVQMALGAASASCAASSSCAASASAEQSLAFFSESTGQAMKDELKRITGQNWKYSKKTSIAFLEMDQQQSLIDISSHLQQAGISVSPVKQVLDSTNSLISITSSELLKLKITPVLAIPKVLPSPAP